MMKSRSFAVSVGEIAPTGCVAAAAATAVVTATAVTVVVVVARIGEVRIGSASPLSFRTFVLELCGIVRQGVWLLGGVVLV